MSYFFQKLIGAILLLSLSGCAHQTIPPSQLTNNAQQQNSIHDSCFQSIYGSQPDYTLAHQWCSQGAELGTISDRTLLGELFFFGLGTKKNHTEAFQHYRIAANNGHSHAQYMMYHLYHQGLGVKRFPTQAEIWLQKSAKNGNPRALQLIASKNH